MNWIWGLRERRKNDRNDTKLDLGGRNWRPAWADTAKWDEELGWQDGVERLRLHLFQWWQQNSSAHFMLWVFWKLQKAGFGFGTILKLQLVINFITSTFLGKLTVLLVKTRRKLAKLHIYFAILHKHFILLYVLYTHMAYKIVVLCSKVKIQKAFMLARPIININNQQTQMLQILLKTA